MTQSQTDLKQLTDTWKQAKAEEQIAQNKRLGIEAEILQITAGQLPEKGTTTLEGGMKIVTGFREEWNQDHINTAYQSWPEGVAFPFKGEWKPDGKAIAYIRENIPALYDSIRGGLTLKSSKPSFSAKGE